MKILRLSLTLLIISLCFAVSCQATKAQESDVREPVVAGKFYPDSAAKLRLAVEKFLQDAVPVKVKKPIAIIVPHAGYIFSGQICADGFKQVSNQKYDVVVVLGTNHTTVLATVEGPARGILTGERVALNFTGHLSGIATATNALVEAVKGTKARIVCTRKTTARPCRGLPARATPASSTG